MFRPYILIPLILTEVIQGSGKPRIRLFMSIIIVIVLQRGIVIIRSSVRLRCKCLRNILLGRACTNGKWSKGNSLGSRIWPLRINELSWVIIKQWGELLNNLVFYFWLSLIRGNLKLLSGLTYIHEGLSRLERHRSTVHHHCQTLSSLNLLHIDSSVP